MSEPLLVYVTPDAPYGRVSFSVDETAQLLGVSPGTVRTAIRKGRLAAFKVVEGGRSVRIPAWSIDELTKQRAEVAS